jgi:sec-independent protein translocase protein TatA
MLRNISATELIIVLLIVLVVFGVGRLGELGGALGKAIREFRQEVSGMSQDAEQEKPVEEETEE